MKKKIREKGIISNRRICSIMAVCMLLSVFFIQPMIKMDHVKAASYVAATEYDGIGSDKISNCVAFARYKVPSLPGGLYNLEDKKNIINSHTPAAGAIAITSGNSSYGHVAYVESVSGANVVTLNGGFSGLGLTGHIVRITGTESEQGILGYWYPAGVSAGNNPQGCLDGMWGDNGTVYVGGWAFDWDDVNTPLAIHVYIGGAAGSPVAEGHAIVAGNERQDVGNAYPGAGNNHGYSAEISTQKTGEQPVYVYAINVGGGDNTLLGQGTVNIKPVYNPEGCVDSVWGDVGGVHVSGWAFDRDDVNASLSIHVYIGGDVGTSGAECHIIKAGNERSDVGAVYLGVGNNHGYSAEISTQKTGEQPVYVYAINVGSGGNTLLGQGTADISEPINEPTPEPQKTPGVTIERKEAKPTPTSKSTISPEVKPETVIVPVVRGLSVKNQRGRKVKCSWKKISGARYYSVQIARNRSFTKENRGFKVYGTKYTRYALKRKKTYYVRVRAWKYVDGRGYVAGKWSAVKKVKIRR